MGSSNGNIWVYRGYRLKKLEWGLWKAIDEPGRFFLCYRPRGFWGPFVRRWVLTDSPALTLDDLRQHVRNIRAQIQAQGIEHTGSCAENCVTVSIGLAHIEPHATERSLEGFVQMADEALYIAKSKGRNCVVDSDDASSFEETGVFSLKNRYELEQAAASKSPA